MPNSDAPGYKIFEGGVVWFLGKYRKVEKPVARTKKVPGYIKLGRSGRHAPWRPFLRLAAAFWENLIDYRGLSFQNKKLHYRMFNRNSGREHRPRPEVYIKYAPLYRVRIIIQFPQGHILADKSRIPFRGTLRLRYPSATVANRRCHSAHNTRQ